MSKQAKPAEVKSLRRDQAKLFLQLWLGLVGGGLLIGWLMYPFPLSPPG